MSIFVDRGVPGKVLLKGKAKNVNFCIDGHVGAWEGVVKTKGKECQFVLYRQVCLGRCC